METERIINKILASKKYKDLNPQTVRRIVTDSIVRYGTKRASDKSRRLLHQIWAIYIDEPRLDQFNTNMGDVNLILSSHRSSKERLPHLKDFYDAIFSLVDEPKTIVDYACGLNPIAFNIFRPSFTGRYLAFDIDFHTINLLNQTFLRLSIENRFQAEYGDLLTSGLIKADLALFLKTLPTIELQKKGASREILISQPSRFLVVSYPLKSVSGVEKGMGAFYEMQFSEMTTSLNWQIQRQVVGNELVFIVDKGMNGVPS